MAKKELPIPDEYRKDVEEIHQEILKKFSPEISTIAGEFAYDATRGAAEQISMLRDMMIHFLLMRAFTSTSDEKYLEMIGEMRGVFKKEATKSVGYVVFTGKVGTIIPKGTVVSTESRDSVNGLSFVTLEMGSIGESGSVRIKAESIEAGTISNVREGAIKVLNTEIADITSVTNELFQNGTDIEDEESFRKRIEEAEKEEQLSGADTDYERWAKEVDGVGYAYCRDSWNRPGRVKILILDKNRDVASSELIAKVKDYIWPDVKPGSVNRGGKAPTGIEMLTIESPATKEVGVSGNFILSEGYSKETVSLKIKNLLNKYFDTLDIEGTIKYNMVLSIIGTLLVNGEGVEDFSNITINGSTRNIKLNSELASVSVVNMS